jgi:hypothetical protein
VGAPNHSRLLYYFTPQDGLADVVSGERLPPDASVPTTRFGVLRRPSRLVWLSDLAELTPQQAAGRAAVRPGVRSTADTLARVTVSVPDAQYWPRWADRHGISQRRQAAFDRDADGLSGRWWVVARAIPASEWLAVEPATSRLRSDWADAGRWRN